MIHLDAIYQGPAQQAIYRALLEAFSYPGRLLDLAEPLQGRPAAHGVLATLLDRGTPLLDLHGQLDSVTWTMLGSPRTESADTVYQLVDGTQPPPESYEPPRGQIERPEFGATLVVTVDRLVEPSDADGDRASEPDRAVELICELSGPGIPDRRTFMVRGLDPRWLERRQDWGAAFPLGVDILLCDARRVVGLPRTTMLVFRDRAS